MPKLGRNLDHNYNERTPLLISSQPKKRSSGFESKRRKSRSPHGSHSGRSSPASSMSDLGDGVPYQGEMYFPEMVQARPPGN